MATLETDIRSGTQQETSGLTRREFLNYAWLASLGIFLAETGGMMYVFTMPRFRVGEFGGVFPMGKPANYSLEDDPVYIPRGNFYDENAELMVDTSQRILGKPRGQSYEEKT